MRATLLAWLYSGQLFFVAVALFALVAAADLSLLLERRAGWRRIASVTILLAFVLAIFSAPPLPVVAAVSASAIAAAYLFVGFGSAKRRAVLGGIAIAAASIVVAIELPYHLKRTLLPRPAQLVVIGDSLSSGGFGEQQPWPQVLGRVTGVPVVNLSLASSTAAMAIERQLPNLPRLHTDSCVIIAIGGNDMLDATDAARFEADLERLIAQVKRAGNPQVLIPEIPLLPGRWSYGAVQRRVARKHRCTLLPKRVIARVLANEANTFDGIHLTQRGHDELAREVRAHLGW